MKQEAANEYVGHIYKVTNKITNKIYIGETLNTIEKRFYQHCKDAFNETYKNYYFYRSIRKYGIENFEITELQTVYNSDRRLLKKQILEIEENYIKEYDSFNNGYNSNSGGRHPLEVSVETKKLQRQRKLDDPNTNSNMKHARSFQKTEKEVVAYNYSTGEIIDQFDSIKKAADCYNIDSSGISKVCKGITNYLGTIDDIKITWRYIDDLYEIPFQIKVFNENGELLNKFLSFADGARYYNIKHQETISRCCAGKTKCTGRKKGEKLIWRFINDNFNI